MKRKLLVFLLIATLTFANLFTLVACDGETGGGFGGGGDFITITVETHGGSENVKLNYPDGKSEYPKGAQIELVVYFNPGYNHEGLSVTVNGQPVEGTVVDYDDFPDFINLATNREWRASVIADKDIKVVMDATACKLIDVSYVIDGMDDLEYVVAVEDEKVHTTLSTCFNGEVKPVENNKITVPFGANFFIFSSTDAAYLRAEYEVVGPDGFTYSAGSVFNVKLDGRTVKYNDKFAYYFETYPAFTDDVVIHPNYDTFLAEDRDIFHVLWDKQVHNDTGIFMIGYPEGEEYTLNGQRIYLGGMSYNGNGSQYAYVGVSLVDNPENVGNTSISDKLYYLFDEDAFGTAVENMEFYLTAFDGSGRVSVNPVPITRVREDEADEQLYCIVIDRTTVADLAKDKTDGGESFRTGMAVFDVKVKQSALNTDFIKFKINETTSGTKALCYSPSVYSGAVYSITWMDDNYNRYYSHPQVNEETGNYEYYLAKDKLFDENGNIYAVELWFWPSAVNREDAIYLWVSSQILRKNGDNFPVFAGSQDSIEIDENHRTEIPLVVTGGSFPITRAAMEEQQDGFTLNVSLSRKAVNGLGAVDLSRLNLQPGERLYMSKNRTAPIDSWLEITANNAGSVNLSIAHGETWYFVIKTEHFIRNVYVKGIQEVDYGDGPVEYATYIASGDSWTDLMRKYMKVKIDEEEYVVNELKIPYGYFEDYDVYLMTNDIDAN
ncbi:MAG: hypothetical protein J1F33_06185 [Clostridiales bacterium]|nr:hypothetical protein [Clostridiales bacterium]